MNSHYDDGEEGLKAVDQTAGAGASAIGATDSAAALAIGSGRWSKKSGGERDDYLESVLGFPPLEAWPEAVDGAELLEEIRLKIMGHVVLPKWGPETMALWVAHTFGFSYRDITTYLGIESPEHRCGKSTLITILSEMSQRGIKVEGYQVVRFACGLKVEGGEGLGCRQFQPMYWRIMRR